ncbi:streptophobe family protein [Streptomyces paradoxus]|uniref:streptophobe family protein n=1 Tax=Streptomyces paradoxus TaxID=66375 RepID=UPI0036F5BC42
MSAAAGAGTATDDVRLPWGDVLMSAVAAVSWALIGMAGTAALGLRMLEADTAGSLGPMTAAVVALGAGGSVTPSGEVSAFGLTGAEADTAIEITPLGVSLVGALLLSWFFLRSLRAAGVVISRAELLARAGTVVALFVAMLGGLAWAGHDVITIDGGSLGLDDVTGGSGGVEIPGLGDVGGLLPDRLGDLVDAQASVGFTVDTAPTLLGGFGWSAGILLIALLASRRTPLPRGWEAVHRVVRPAVSAVVTVLLVAVAAGFAAAAYAATGDDGPERIAGAALLGAPNGVWLGIPLGLFVPWDGRATGELIRFLPDPMDDLLGAGSERPVTLGRLAELDGRVWLLAVAAGLMMLLAGVLTGVRTPVGEEPGVLRFAGWCALRLGLATALALPLLAWLTDVSVTASLSVLGFDAFGGGIELHGHLVPALLLGAVWGAGAGAVGALLAWVCGAAGRRATASARGEGLALAAGAAGLPGQGLPSAGGAAGLPGAGWPGGAGGPGAEGRHAESGASGAGQAAPWGGRGPTGWGESAGRGRPEGGAGHAGGGQGPGRYDGGAGQAWPGAGRPGEDAGGWRAQTWGGPGPAEHDRGSRHAQPGAGAGRPQDNAGAGQAQSWGGPGRTEAGPGPVPHDEGAGQAWPGAGARRREDNPGTGQAQPPGGPRPTGRHQGPEQTWPRADAGRPEDNPDTGQSQPRSGPRPTGRPQGSGQARPGAGAPRPERDAGDGPGLERYDAGAGAGRPEDDAGGRQPGVRGEEAGPYAPGTPYRPPNPGTNPYLRVPDELREPQDAGPGADPPSGAEDDAAPDDGPPAPGDVYGAPTVVRPVGPPPRGPRQSPGPRNGNGPPPPPPPPPPPRQPRGGR